MIPDPDPRDADGSRLPLSRRAFVAGTTALLAGGWSAAAGADPARLTARPRKPTGAIAPGETPLGLGGDRDGLLFVPASYDPARPAPLVVLLHGAGQSARLWQRFPLQALLAERGIVAVAPESRGPTWESRPGGPDGDVAFIDRALAATYARCAIDPARVALAGFSDGASYALSLGVTNGDVFDALLAFSPGYMQPAGRRGRPRIFQSHGTRDAILPIDVTSRRLVRALRSLGYEVAYEEFDGPHTMTPAIATRAVEWLVRGSQPPGREDSAI